MAHLYHSNLGGSNHDLRPADLQTDCSPQRGAAPALDSPDYHENLSENWSSFHAEDQDDEVRDAPPPPYSESYSLINMNDGGFSTMADVANDGRLNININDRARRLSRLIAPALLSRSERQSLEEEDSSSGNYHPPSLTNDVGPPPPPMNVVIQVVGSRGDVQPFVALGQVLKRKYKHRVRLATHAVFRNFVEENGLEFFDIGGDPAELMAFMVKNPGLVPGISTLRSGEIDKRRKGIYGTLKGCWRSCFETHDGSDLEMGDAEPRHKPFVADAIIANPPSFAHIHCAEKLGIPLHLMFTMPWSPTRSFPHPLANIKSTRVDERMTNYLSYVLVEMMTWQGLGDLINRFREKILGLERLRTTSGPGMAARLEIPHTYCWSPALIPKPRDWESHLTISGFYFLSLASDFKPPPPLLDFFDAGSPPVYIGFGSIVVDDPEAMTNLIFQAIRRTGQRALVSAGWGGLGIGSKALPDGVFMLGNVPHDWLFQRVSCVVHHGGAGTTAAGIAAGKPTVIVPFFGDQPFWGSMVAAAGAGPDPIPHGKMTAENLANAILFALQPTTLQKAKDIGAKIAAEDGNEMGARSFHHGLNTESLRCSLSPDRVTAWRVKKSGLQLSALAATVLCEWGLLRIKDLKPFRPKEYEIEEGPSDPLSGGASAVIGAFMRISVGVLADVPAGAYRAGVRMKKESDGKKRAETLSLSERDPAGAPRDSSIDSLPDMAFSKEFASPGRSIKGRPEYSSYPANGDVHFPSKKASSENSSLSESTSGKRPSAESGISPQNSGAISSSPSSHPAPPSSLKHVNLRPMTVGSAMGAGKGVGRIIDSAIDSPMDISMSFARGFHNAPKLYGDDTVRRTDRVTDLQSGLIAAGKEFGFGFYDALSGVITQPIRGAKKEGFTGALKGIGKGLGGLVLKPGAALFGIPAYALKGVQKEFQKHLGSELVAHIAASRMAQGYDELNNSTPEECKDIVTRWYAAEYEHSKGRRGRSRARHARTPDESREHSRRTDSVEVSPAPSWRLEPEAQEVENSIAEPTPSSLPVHSYVATKRRGVAGGFAYPISRGVTEGEAYKSWVGHDPSTEAAAMKETRSPSTSHSGGSYEPGDPDFASGSGASRDGDNHVNRGIEARPTTHASARQNFSGRSVRGTGYEDEDDHVRRAHQESMRALCGEDNSSTFRVGTYERSTQPF